MNSDINIVLSGYSGQGIQYLGYHISYILYRFNYYIKTFSNIPSEILSPTKTKEDLSEFIIRFSNKKIYSFYSYKKTIFYLTNYISFIENLMIYKKNSCLILDVNYNDKKKIKSFIKNNGVKYSEIYFLNSKKYIKISVLIKFGIKLISSIEKFKNSIFIGFLLKFLNLPTKESKKFLRAKFLNTKIYLVNYYLLKIGYKIGPKNKKNFLLSKNKEKIKKKYSLINGNMGICLGLIFASIKYKRKLFYSSYPITPSTTINKYLKKNLKVVKDLIVFDAEDEISAICTSIGASLYDKYIGVSGTSGPGMSLMQEALGLAVALEIPLIIINVQRVGPSTGYPTKLEQSDLMQAIYGRHGEAPIPVFALNNISNIVKILNVIFKISFEIRTPIIILSDISIANNYSLFQINKNSLLKEGQIDGIKKYNSNKCIGGLITNISTHSKIIKKRQKKINSILKKYKKSIYIFRGDKIGKILIISWGSTNDIINESINILNNKKYKIGYIHFICIYPIKYKLINKISKNYKKIIVLELNNKQLYYIIKSYCNIKTKILSFNKITGYPFLVDDIVKYIKNVY